MILHSRPCSTGGNRATALQCLNRHVEFASSQHRRRTAARGLGSLCLWVRASEPKSSPPSRRRASGPPACTAISTQEGLEAHAGPRYSAHPASLDHDARRHPANGAPLLVVYAILGSTWLFIMTSFPSAARGRAPSRALPPAPPRARAARRGVDLDGLPARVVYSQSPDAIFHMHEPESSIRERALWLDPQAAGPALDSRAQRPG